MKTLTKMQVLWVAAILMITACSQEYFVRPEVSTPASAPIFQGTVSGMDLVEALATGTAQAETQAAQPGGLAILETQAAQTLPAQLTEVASQAAALAVILPDDARVDFSFEEIQSLASLTLDAFDQPRQAVSLLVLLEQAGWQRYPLLSVTVVGRTSMTFHVKRLPADAALYIDNDTFNFVASEIPAEDWPMDVVLILVH